MTRSATPVNTMVTKANLAAAAYLSALSFLFGNVQPVILGTMSEHLDIGILQVGFLASLFMLVSGAIKVTAPVWIRAADMRLLSAIAIVLAAGAFTYAALAETYQALMVGIVFFAIAEGIYGTTSYTVLGDYTNPSRAYAIAIVSQMVLAAVFIVVATSVLEPLFGYTGIMLSFAVLIASGILFYRLIPSRTSITVRLEETRSQPEQRITLKQLIPFVLALFATVLFLAAIMALWVFSERYASSIGLGLQFVGTSVAVASIVTAIAALLSASLSHRLPPAAMATGGALIVLLGVFLLTEKIALSYLLGMSLLSFGWGLAQPFYYGVVRLADPTGRLFTAVPAMINVGIASGIAIGGYIADNFGFINMMIVAAAALIISVLILAISTQGIKKMSYEGTHANA